MLGVTAADRVGELLAALARHEPTSGRESWSVARTRALVRWLPRPFDEGADPTHVTASAVVLDGAGRTLLHRHRRLGIWLQPGGHVEAGEAPAEAALREAVEETGVDVAHPGGVPRLVHVDVHPGPRGHLHLDLRYLLLAPGSSEPRPAPGESAAVRWFPVEEAVRRGDASLAGALRRAVARPLSVADVRTGRPDTGEHAQ